MCNKKKFTKKRANEIKAFACKSNTSKKKRIKKLAKKYQIDNFYIGNRNEKGIYHCKQCNAWHLTSKAVSIDTIKGLMAAKQPPKKQSIFNVDVGQFDPKLKELLWQAIISHKGDTHPVCKISVKRKVHDVFLQINQQKVFFRVIYSNSHKTLDKKIEIIRNGQVVTLAIMMVNNKEAV